MLKERKVLVNCRNKTWFEDEMEGGEGAGAGDRRRGGAVPVALVGDEKFHQDGKADYLREFTRVRKEERWKGGEE